MSDGPPTSSDDEDRVAGNRWKVSIGGVDVSSEVRLVQRHPREENDRLRTLLVLHNGNLRNLGFDYLATVEIDSVDDAGSSRYFNGNVRSARRGATSLVLDCLSGLDVSDWKAGFLQYQRCGVDVIYSLMRSAGYQDDEMDFDGLDQLPHERFEIVAPVSGLAFDRERVSLRSQVHLVDRQAAARIVNLESAPLDHHHHSGFLTGSTAFLIARVWAFVAHDAQVEGLRRMDEALDILTLASRYSYSRLPAGELADYDRQGLTFACRRGDLVALRGESTGRAWLRRSSPDLRDPQLSPEKPPLAYVRGASPGTPGTAQSIGLLLKLAARAAVLTEPVDRVTTLWQALEFYAANTATPQIFDAKTIRAIRYVLRKYVRKNLSADQNSRLSDLVSSLNDPPLMVKLKQQLDIDGIPISDVEFGVLRRLRKLRNDANHGRDMSRLTKSDVDLGVAILARIALLYTKPTASSWTDFSL